MVEKLVIDAQAPQQGALEAQRLEEMRETTDRMVADRMAREKHSAEVEKLQAETRADLAAQEFPDYYKSATVYSQLRLPLSTLLAAPEQPSTGASCTVCKVHW